MSINVCSGVDYHDIRRLSITQTQTDSSGQPKRLAGQFSTIGTDQNQRGLKIQPKLI